MTLTRLRPFLPSLPFPDAGLPPIVVGAFQEEDREHALALPRFLRRPSKLLRFPRWDDAFLDAAELAASSEEEEIEFVRPLVFLLLRQLLEQEAPPESVSIIPPSSLPLAMMTRT